ncbi:hypothetical protein ACFQZZ_09455 [Nocardia sp. GCM10030253]|uniref:hypothetical protein n=1 Tax=Nocardia sp. GCM10030253 TaxID=3273404 RepID=UPI00363BB3EA
MWGAPGSPAWAEHGPALLADRLRGKTIYLSTGTGIPGPREAEIKPQLAENIFLGGPIPVQVSGAAATVASRTAMVRGVVASLLGVEVSVPGKTDR